MLSPGKYQSKNDNFFRHQNVFISLRRLRVCDRLVDAGVDPVPEGRGHDVDGRSDCGTTWSDSPAHCSNVGPGATNLLRQRTTGITAAGTDWAATGANVGCGEIVASSSDDGIQEIAALCEGVDGLIGALETIWHAGNSGGGG